MAIWRDIDKDEAQPYHIAVVIMGLFIGMSVIYLLVMNTFITIDTVFNIFFICGLVVFGIHFLFRKRLQRYIAELAMVSFGGYALLITALFLLLNYTIHSTPQVEKYGLAHNVNIVVPDPDNPVPISVADPQFDDFQYMLKFQGEDEIKAGYVSQAWMTTARGCFGYKILLHKELH
jgi:hypothetical protein